MTGRVAGKVAIATGGGRDIGEACARALVAEGAKVVVGDILDTDGKALPDALGESAGYVTLDVASGESWDDAVAYTVAEFGSLTTLSTTLASPTARSCRGSTSTSGNATSISTSPAPSWACRRPPTR